MRRKTRTVQVGKLGIGSEHPIRIQSMTTSDTRDVQATVDQIAKLADYGAELVRVTVQGKKEAAACEEIKNELIKRGLEIPLVADIHFYPPAALMVADFVDKVRINPGNFADKRATFKTLSYSDESYQEELVHLEEVFAPLVWKCKERGVAMRIGTNHGSLSDRILNRFGDTPKGMCESALEFARVARKYDYHNFLFSMKASNPLVMIEAYRRLVEDMEALGWDYPLHLGVTEAGEGEDGRIKSAVGIGSLLLEGIGDTIRVSLTEDPWQEIEPCKQLIHVAEKMRGSSSTFPRKVRERRKIPLPPPLHRDGSVFLVQKLGEEGIPTKGDALISIEEGAGHLFADRPEEWILKPETPFIILELGKNPIGGARRFYAWMEEQGKSLPLILLFKSGSEEALLPIETGVILGSLLCEGIGEGIALDVDLPLEKRESLSFSLLQACRLRFSKTDFIACPGCGRTLFPLQNVLMQIKEKTGHLEGVKIAVMGCIVNGPGEMADADFGYVGSRSGMVDLYVGKVCVEKNILSEHAVDHLVDLIKKEGKWKEPEFLLAEI